MTLIAIIFLRNQLRPIKRLAAASEAFGKGRVVPFSPDWCDRSAGGRQCVFWRCERGLNGRWSNAQ